MNKALLISLAVAAAITPATASAATLKSTAGSGPANGPYLVYRAAAGERNHVTVTAGKENGIVITDPGARIKRSGGFNDCRYSRSGHRATCDVTAFVDFVIRLGDRDDTLRFKGSDRTKYGPAARTSFTNALKLGEAYDDLEGANPFHADIAGGTGNDDLRGTNGPDRIAPGAGRDRVDGGGGDDVIDVSADGRKDVLRGGRRLDTVRWTGKKAVTVDLAKRTIGVNGDVDTLDSIERGIGGPGDDTLLGSEDSDGLLGDGGSDTLDGRGGPDYLSGDLFEAQLGSRGKNGVDKLTGGAGNDVLDGRDGDGSALTPTDQLVCGDGADAVIGLQDDLADASCESTFQGIFKGDLYINQRVYAGTLSPLQPVARGADGAPTYEIACAGFFTGKDACTGTVQLEAPPVTGEEKTPTVLGTSAKFTIAAHARQNVPVVLNDAGRLALAQPGARASVHVVFGGEKVAGEPAEFGWQQVLGP